MPVMQWRQRVRVWRRWLRRVWIAAGVSFMAWLVWSMAPHDVPPAMYEASAAVRVESLDTAMVFEPRSPRAGALPIVFLPGGGVSPYAYVPFVRRWADDGHPVALVYLPWRMALSASSQAEVWRRVDAVAARWPGRPFVLGGHSRGAALAAKFAVRHHQQLAGLLLVGTTHPRDDDLSGLRLPVLKVEGTRDCVAPPEQSRANAWRLPATAIRAVIDGGNHAQFAHYGSQLGDCRPAISREEQQRQAHERIRTWLTSVP